MQKMNIEITYEDQMFLENVCTEKGLSYSEFFKICLDLYKDNKPITKKQKKETLPKNQNKIEDTK